jgi:cyclic pyranopterin phosphate synthase
VPKRLTHLDDKGAARMVDVSAKATTAREALAECVVRMSPATLRAVREGTAKGDAIAVARVAGIMAAKRTSELIPLCHPLPLTSVDVDLQLDPELPGVRITATARCTAQTGVEMEALTAATVAALTVVDMAKAADRWMTVEGVGLLSKRGGRSGSVERPEDRPL